VKPERAKRWTVRPGDGATVGEIVAKAGAPPRAIAEGRVFVGRRRVGAAGEPVAVGDEVRIGEGAPGPGEPGGLPGRGAPTEASTVLFERDGLVACIKPAGIPTVPDHAGSAHSLVAEVARRIGVAPSELRVTSRLDREVSGVVLLATSAEAEARLREARTAGRYHRRYVAIAIGVPSELDALEARGAAAWTQPIGRGADPRHRAVDGPEAKACETRFRVVARAGEGAALLGVAPITGRTHQIRVHASHARAPLLGDRDYGGPVRMTLPTGAVIGVSRIALHAAEVQIVPPELEGGRGGPPLVVSAPIPPALERAWRELGGAPEAWNTARACALDG